MCWLSCVHHPYGCPFSQPNRWDSRLPQLWPNVGTIVPRLGLRWGNLHCCLGANCTQLSQHTTEPIGSVHLGVVRLCIIWLGCVEGHLCYCGIVMEYMQTCEHWAKWPFCILEQPGCFGASGLAQDVIQVWVNSTLLNQWICSCHRYSFNIFVLNKNNTAWLQDMLSHASVGWSMTRAECRTA